MFTIISFFQKLIKGGVGIRVGGLKIFEKLTSGGDDYSVLESTFTLTQLNQFYVWYIVFSKPT